MRFTVEVPDKYLFNDSPDEAQMGRRQVAVPLV